MGDKATPPAAAASPSVPAGNSPEAAAVAVDPNHGGAGNDGDSALGDGSTLATSTASLGSSIFEYRKVHGRTYQNFKDAEYWAPNDDAQNDGLDLHHHMMFLLHDNSLFKAPLENPQEVLDVGTGTGIWAMDFADQFPSARVTGTDLSPIQPAWTPPNCKFELDDASLEWTFGENTFDFIHIRLLLGSIADWVKLYREAYRCLKPGGWIEHTDMTILIQSDDGSVPETSAYMTWNALFKKAGELTGRTFLVAHEDGMVKRLREAGFADVNVRNYKLPVGAWPADKRQKEIGIFNQVSCEQGLEGYVLYLGTKVLGWTYEEVQVLLVQMRKDLKNPSYHAWYPCTTTWSQKPLA